jgi:3-oxosteroid 1-dehydrogenase
MKEVDVVVVGCGLAGLAAAVAARRLGLSVAALEKAERVGGGTAYSWGMLWGAPNHIAEHEGVHDDPADVQRYMTYVARGEAEAGRMRTLIERTPEALRFFEACGIRFQLTHNLSDHHHGVAPGSRALGRTLETAPIAGRDLAFRTASRLSSANFLNFIRSVRSCCGSGKKMSSSR